jgi:hypothetical protein
MLKKNYIKRGLKALFKIYKCLYNKQFNFRELRVTGLQVWSKISGRSLINGLNRLGFNTRLENFLFKRNIRPEQIGFCKNKRTSDHMFVLKTLIEKYTQNNPSPFFMHLICRFLHIILFFDTCF